MHIPTKTKCGCLCAVSSQSSGFSQTCAIMFCILTMFLYMFFLATKKHNSQFNIHLEENNDMSKCVLIDMHKLILKPCNMIASIPLIQIMLQWPTNGNTMIQDHVFTTNLQSLTLKSASCHILRAAATLEFLKNHIACGAVQTHRKQKTSNTSKNTNTYIKHFLPNMCIMFCVSLLHVLL